MPSWGSQESRPGMTVKKLVQGGNYGNQHTMAFLMNDGTMRTIGRSLNYSNAQTNNNHIYLPQTVPVNPEKPPTAPFKAIYRNYASFFALTEDGQVFSWGHNQHGVLGHGDVLNRHHAIRIDWFVDNGIQIKEVICASDCTWSYSTVYFITTTGELYACGYNNFGQLGDGTTTARHTPVRCGNLTNVKQVSASCTDYTSAFAIDGNDDLWAWGRNSHGQLGQGDTANRHSPTKVSNLSNVKQVFSNAGDGTSSGAQLNTHVIVLLQDGTLYSAGDNGYGQLGVGDLNDRHSFTLLSGSLPVIKQIYASGGFYGYSAALDENDELWTWGYNNYGVLGHGDTTHRNAPIKVSAEFQGNIEKVILGGNYSHGQIVIIDKDGRLWGVGYNGQGQLARGNGFTASNPIFARIITPLESPFLKIIDAAFVGNSTEGTFYALTEDGRVFSSGHNAYGQCGTQGSNLSRADALYTSL